MEVITPKGLIKAKVRYKNGEYKVLQFPNHVLNGGKEFLAKCLLEGSPKLNIAFMLFGDGGTTNGNPKDVLLTQDKLNGVVRVKKPVVAQIDPESPTQVIFSTVVKEDEGNGFALNEMGLELSDGTLYSLSTFPDFNKTDQMEVDWSWVVYYS